MSIRKGDTDDDVTHFVSHEVSRGKGNLPRFAIITVTPQVEQTNLDEDDQGIEGVYGVAMGDEIGEHPTEPRDLDSADEKDGAEGLLIEAAKDVFHDTIAIRFLDDFDIDVEILPEGAGAPGDWNGEHIDWL